MIGIYPKIICYLYVTLSVLRNIQNTLIFDNYAAKRMHGWLGHVLIIFHSIYNMPDTAYDNFNGCRLDFLMGSAIMHGHKF